MIKTFEPKQTNLPWNIIRTFEAVERWHAEHGPKWDLSLDELLSLYTGWTNEAFTILVQRSSEQHHGNCGVFVFNREYTLIDDRIYMSPDKNGRIPRKAPMGARVIDGSKPMIFRPRRKKDKVFVVPQ